MARVQDKVALITGASGGIGSETARLLAREGAFVILSDIRDDIGIGFAKEIGERALYLHLDVANAEHWRSASALIRHRFGGLDILFNCAGVSGFEVEFEGRPQNIEQVSLDDWRRIHFVNVDGVFLGCKFGVTLMKGRGGSIINMSSRAGMVGIGETAGYCSSKGAVRNLTKSVAMHCAQNGLKIRCNSLHPGAILTPMWDFVLGDAPEQREETLAFVRRGIPLNEMGRPIDVAYSVLYLASDESRYLTGSELVIDGGIMAGTTATPTPIDADD